MRTHAISLCIILAPLPCLEGIPTVYNPKWFVLSINQSASQTSTAENGEAFRAVDGHLDPQPSSCSLTLPATNVYFAINFGRSVYPALVLFHTDPSVKERYLSVTMRIGDSASYSQNTVAKGFHMNLFNYVANSGKKGRFLSIGLTTTDPEPLSLCEVYAFRLPVDNLSARKPVTMTKVPGQPVNHPERQLVDMHWASMASTHMMRDSWIRLDLLDIYFVAEVIAVPYARKIFEQLYIAVGSSLVNGGRANPACVAGANLEMSEARSFPCALKGRYVVVFTSRPGNVAVTLSELVVNPTHAANIAEAAEASFPRGLLGHAGPSFVTDCWFNNGIVTVDVGTGHWLRVDLGSSFPVAKIYIVNIHAEEYREEMVGFELRVGDSLTNEGNDNPLCLPGAQNILGKETASFYCTPARVAGRYVNVRQTTAGKRVALSEIAVYSECPPEIKDRTISREIWQPEGSGLSLTCDAYGYPAPVITWMKNDVVIQNDSSTLVVGNAATFSDSGTYECWAENLYGKDFKPVDVSITSDLRPCVDSTEVLYDLGGTSASYPVREQNFVANKWYHFLEASSHNYLQMVKKGQVKESVCNATISGQHPGVSDGVVERRVCVKVNNVECHRQFDVRVRNCGAYYVYNLPSSRETSGFTYCFNKATKASGTPALAVMTAANTALVDHVIHRETEIPDSTQCILMCFLKNHCQSINFTPREKICELNSSTKAKHPASFVPREGYYYDVRGKGLLSRRVEEL